MKFKREAGAAGPSSALGIMRFFDTDVGGPKLTPEFVVALSLIFGAVVLVIHVVF